MGINHFGNQGTSKRWIALLVSMMLSLGACMPISPTGTLSTLQPATATPAEEITQMPTEGATTEPTVQAGGEITPEATAELTEEVTTTATVDASPVVSQVTQMLAQQLQISADQIIVVSAEPVDWPDACLGVESADMMCAQVITPGYRIVLSANDQQYEYHTNKDGSFIQLASAPQASIGDTLISWQQSSDSCQAGQIGTKGVAYGPCMGVMMGGKLSTPDRAKELNDFVAFYAPFEAQTPAGDITFKGQGSAIARPIEQRMIAEWARLAVTEASTGSADPNLGLALTWHRKGGIAGFCDDFSAYVTGLTQGSSCRPQTNAKLKDRHMSMSELEQLYSWLDQYTPFTFHHDDGMAADSMAIDLDFKGRGKSVANDATQQQIVSFAERLYTALGQ